MQIFNYILILLLSINYVSNSSFSLFGVNVNNLSGPLQKDIVNLYERYWNEKNGDMSGTWKDTAAAAGGKRSKKAKKTKKVKRSKRAKKSIKNKKC